MYKYLLVNVKTLAMFLSSTVKRLTSSKLFTYKLLGIILKKMFNF